MFDYLTIMLQDDPASAPSAGQSLLQAINFASGVEDNRRCRWAAKGERSGRGFGAKWTSCHAGHPSHGRTVKRLETLACVVDSAADRATMGGLFILMYSCSRHSDSLAYREDHP